MNEAELVQLFEDLSSEELRRAIALAAGICAHRDGDGGLMMGLALERIAARLTAKPRRAVA